jgi:hypothetical protein
MLGRVRERTGVGPLGEQGPVHPRHGRPAVGTGVVDPARALAWLDDLRSLWEIELPERPEHAATRREYEVRRAEATAAAFERLEVLGPVIVEAKVAEDLLAGRALIEAIAPERAVLIGDKAEVMAQLVGGKQPWIRRADTSMARRKREWRAEDRTKRSIGRGERSQTSGTDLFVPVAWPVRVRVLTTTSVA